MTVRIKVLPHTTNPKKQHFATTTLKFGLAKCSETISYIGRLPRGPRHLAPTQDKATETGNQQLRHVTHIWDQSLWAIQYIILRRSHGQVTKAPGQAPHITTEYSVDSRKRTLLTRVCLHIQKPKPQASIKNKIDKVNKLFDVYNTIHKRWWGRAVAMAMLPPPPTKLITLPWQRGFIGGGKKEKYVKPLTEGRGVSYGKIGITTVAVTHDLLWGMPLVLLKKNSSAFGTVYYLNQDNPMPNCPNSYASLQATALSCNTHKGKRWLNSNSSKPQGGLSILRRASIL